MRLAGGDSSRRATTDDLQGLLLQVVFALLMVFMIAYFIFVETSKKERAEEILEVNRQKLVLALEKVAEDHRVKYGLNALMTQGTDGRRSFDEGALTEDELAWLDGEVVRGVEQVRLDARGVQRALAARLQRQWIDDPSSLGGISDPGALADALRSKSLRLVAEATGSEVLP